jgi:hypothetical protein
MSDEREAGYEVWDRVTNNLVTWADTLEEAKAKVEFTFFDPTGFVIARVADTYEVVFVYHGPMVTP